MDSTGDKPKAPSELRCYAFVDLEGNIDLDSFATTTYDVRQNVLKGIMGWRFEYPDRYNHDEEWENYSKHGRIVFLKLSFEYA